MAKMSLETVVNLHAYVEVEGTPAVSLSANISSNPNNATTYSESITNADIYYANREEVREQIAVFRERMHSTEDRMVREKTEGEDELPEEDDSPVIPEEEEEE